MARRPIARFVLVFGVLLALATAAAVVLVPRYVKARLIAAAAAHGVALTIDGLSLAPGRARLSGVKASALIRNDAKGAPKVSATAANVDVELDGFTPKTVTVSGASVDVDGDASDVMAALGTRNHDASGAASIERVTITDSAIHWKHALPAQVVAIDAEHVHGDVTKKPSRVLGEDWHLETPDFHAFDKKDLAPWTVIADGDEKGKRIALGVSTAKVALDFAQNGGRSLDIDTPNVTVKELGMPPEALGLYGDETSHFELHLHHHERDAEHAEGTIVCAASNVFMGASTARTSFAIDARYAGDPKTSMKLTAGTLRAGPFTGALEGGFAFDPAAGFKASLRYSSGVMSCLDAVKSQAANYGEIGKGVAALAGMLGLDKAVEGRVMLKGEIEIDSRTNARRFAFHTEGDCKLSYLPSP